MYKNILITWLLILSFLFSIGQEVKNKSIALPEIKNAGPDLKQIGWLRTKHSSEIKSSPWSVGCETLDRDYAKFSVYKNYVGELGVKHARLQSGWAKCEKQKGVYNFAWLDSCVYGLAEQGVNPWICLCYGNSIHKSSIDLGADLFTAEETMAAWCRYVEATVSRYKNVVKEWEIWNEPRHRASPEAYANLLIRTSESIRKIQSDATIMGFTVHGFTPGIVLKFPKAVFDILKEKGKLDVVDYVTYHPYTYNPDECYQMVEELKELVHSYNPKLKIYQGESGAPSEYRETMALSKYEWTELSQAKWDLRRMAGDYMRDIHSSVFTIIDLKYPHEINRKGIIHVNEDKTVDHPKLAYYGVKHVAGLLNDSFVSTGKLDYVSDSKRSISVAGIKNKKKSAILLWYDNQIPDNNLQWDHVALTVKGVNFKQPVYVEMISGKVYEIEKQNWKNAGRDVEFRNLPVWDSPVLIAERSQIQMTDIPATALQVPGKVKVMQCWDDSPTTDIPLVDLLKKHHAKATFNIIPMDERKPAMVKKVKPGDRVLFSFLPKDASPEGSFQFEHLASREMPNIYEGFKVAGHCGVPLGDTETDSKSRMQILMKTKEMIKNEFGQRDCGFVYPGGRYSPSVMKDVEKAGFLYARTTRNSDSLFPLDNPMALPTICHWASPDFWKKYEEVKKKGGLFYFWGHSCELGDDPNLWMWLESIYTRVSADPDAEWIDIIDIFTNLNTNLNLSI